MRRSSATIRRSREGQSCWSCQRLSVTTVSVSASLVAAEALAPGWNRAKQTSSHGKGRAATDAGCGCIAIDSRIEAHPPLERLPSWIAAERTQTRTAARVREPGVALDPRALEPLERGAGVAQDRLSLGDLVGRDIVMLLDQLAERRARLDRMPQLMVDDRRRPQAQRVVRLAGGLGQRLLAAALGEECQRQDRVTGLAMGRQLQRPATRGLGLLEAARRLERPSQRAVRRGAERILLQRAAVERDRLVDAAERPRQRAG